MKHIHLILLLLFSAVLHADPPAVSPASTMATQADLANKLSPPHKWSGCAAAWEFTDVVMAATKVAQWNDRTGNGYHLTQATDALRGIWTATGVELMGNTANYVISNGGIPSLSGRAMSVVWIGRDFTTVDPNAGRSAPNGILYYINSIASGINLESCYGVREYAIGTTFGPGIQLSKQGGISMFAASYGTSAVNYYVNGNHYSRGAGTASAGTLSAVFGFANNTGGMCLPTRALLVFNRALTDQEMIQIAAYYGAPTTSSPLAVYCLGTSTVGAVKATTFSQGCVQMFADSIGASRNVFGIGGASWKTMADSLTTNLVNIPKGQRGIHVVFPQTNDLATNVAVADLQTSTTNLCTRIKAADPNAEFILCPIPARNASFTNGQTYAAYNTARVTYNTWLRANAAALGGVTPAVVADYTSIAGLGGADGDENNTTYYDADKLHWNTAGHLEVSKSLHRAFLSLRQAVPGSYADDAAAAAAGVPIGGMYHTSGALKIRQTSIDRRPAPEKFHRHRVRENRHLLRDADLALPA